MKYVNLGNTGAKVSELCLGCMSFGVPDRGDHPWTLPEEPSRQIIRQAVDLGFNFFDTANAYSDGTSEEILGRALKDFARRDEGVIATKVFFPCVKDPNVGDRCPACSGWDPRPTDSSGGRRNRADSNRRVGRHNAAAPRGCRGSPDLRPLLIP